MLVAILSGLLCGCEGLKKTKKENIDNENDFDNIYAISEFLDDKQFDDYMNDDGTMFSRLLDYKKQIDNSTEFKFYGFANNFIEVIDKDIPAKCIVNYDTEFEADSIYEINGKRVTATEAIQVSKNFFDLFPVNITKGRSFKSTDFDYQSMQTIPVILGNAYQEYFSLGDTFDAYYIGEKKHFQ